MWDILFTVSCHSWVPFQTDAQLGQRFNYIPYNGYHLPARLARESYALEFGDFICSNLGLPLVTCCWYLLHAALSGEYVVKIPTKTFKSTMSILKRTVIYSTSVGPFLLRLGSASRIRQVDYRMRLPYPLSVFN